MSVTYEDGLDTLREHFEGTVLTQSDGEPYEQARALWNGSIDRRPGVVARCASTQDVVNAVAFGRDNGMDIAVRGGGHNYSGNAVCDGGLMIHLGDMKTVSVDPAGQRALAGGGATWGDVDAATQQHGLAVPGGFISQTGIAGLTLGGGIGWLNNQYGLSCDNVVSAEVVLADGRVVQASATENENLFWAIRGGGGNFGIVTQFEFELHSAGPIVNMGMFFWGLDSGTEALRFARDFVFELPRDMTAFLAIDLSAPPAPFVPEQYHFLPGHALVVVSFGAAEAHAEVAERVRTSVPPLFELVTPMPYVALQQMFNDSAPWGLHAYEKAVTLDELSDDVLAVIAEHAPKKASPLSFCPTFALTGAYIEKPEDSNAFGGARRKGFVLNIGGHTMTNDGFVAERVWVRGFWEALRPFASSSGSYVNFQADSDEKRVRETYGAKYDRLAGIKQKYDPKNIFHLNANIKPMS